MAYLLTCLIVALLCNCDSTVAVSQWCRDQQERLKRCFPFQAWLCPSDSLYRKLLARLPADQIEWALADWVRSTLCADANDPIALDGKTIRGARIDGQAAFTIHPNWPWLTMACIAVVGGLVMYRIEPRLPRRALWVREKVTEPAVSAACS